MAVRIEIAYKTKDTKASALLKKLHITSLTDLKILDVYTIDKKLSKDQPEDIAMRLTNPLTKTFTIRNDNNKHPSETTFTYAIEIGFLPGVTDNVATTTKEMIEDALKVSFTKSENVYTSQLYLLTGTLSKKEALYIASSLYNPLIQRMHCKSFAEYKKSGGMDIIIPKVHLTTKQNVSTVNLKVPDEELITIGKQGIANSDGTRRGPLALDLTYMKTIQEYFQKIGRNPTDIELESLAQTWSEHCKHTIFADPIDELKDGLFKSYIKKATVDIRKKKGKKDFCISVFTDNSGGIVFDDDYMVTHKVETHNSPSALDPFGGAITGIVGVNRDAMGFGMGAKPVANFYGYCFADPRVDIPLYKNKQKTMKMLSSKRIMEGVIAGVNAGGNQSGIPTPQGFVYFHERYRGKPLVFVGTIGLIPRKINNKLSHLKKANPGDYVVMVGGRVGKDGIHGATFSSEALDSGSPATAVQIGDPITQKKMSDALIKEARDMQLYTSITDNGAGGLSCSVAEMAKESGGAKVDLEKVPLKYPGLDPWEIWISESQERMTLSIPPAKWEQFHALMQKRGVEATIIGEFTDSGRCIVQHNNKNIVDLPMDFLHDGLPQRPLQTASTEPISVDQKIKENKNITKLALSMLERLNITSFAFISQQYDHIVQGNAVLGPLQGRGRINADASVIRPVLSSQKGVVMSQALYPTDSEIHPYNMASATIDTAIRNAVVTGANPDSLALLDNFCWCSPNDPIRLGQLKKTAEACYDYAVQYETPFVSGKDSMFNDFSGFDEKGNPVKYSIPPTLLISSFGVIDNIEKTVSLDAKKSGDLVYILGETFDEIGGTEFAIANDIEANSVPIVHADKNKHLYKAYYKAVQKNLIASGISIHRGGLFVAAAKTAIGGMLGMHISLKNLPGDTKRNDFALFSESQGRILVTVAKQNKNIFEKIMKGCEYKHIGKITKAQEFIITDKQQKEIINLDVTTLQKSYKKTFSNY